MNIWQNLAIVIGIPVIITGILAAIKIKRNSKHYLSMDWTDVFMPVIALAIIMVVFIFFGALINLLATVVLPELLPLN